MLLERNIFMGTQERQWPGLRWFRKLWVKTDKESVNLKAGAPRPCLGSPGSSRFATLVMYFLFFSSLLVDDTFWHQGFLVTLWQQGSAQSEESMSVPPLARPSVSIGQYETLLADKGQHWGNQSCLAGCSRLYYCSDYLLPFLVLVMADSLMSLTREMDGEGACPFWAEDSGPSPGSAPCLSLLPWDQQRPRW